MRLPKLCFSSPWREGIANLKNLKKRSKRYPAIFVEHCAHASELTGYAEQFATYSKLVLLGSGGSNTSFRAFCGALPEYVTKDVLLLNTQQPRPLYTVKSYCSKHDTVVFAVSKSGANLEVLEPLMSFVDYRGVVITMPESPLWKLAAHINFMRIAHPDVSGRFSAATVAHMVPAAVVGLPVKGLLKGIRRGYKEFARIGKHNPAIRLAYWLWRAECKDKHDVGAAFYSHELYAFMPLLRQLVHESYGKHCKGQTLFGDIAPEIHHHTLQRVLDGRRNLCMLVFSLTRHSHDVAIRVPKSLQAIRVKDISITKLNGRRHSEALKLNMLAMLDALEKRNVPYAHIEIQSLNATNTGIFVAFLQFFAYYSALLRNMNPFDQPAVEMIKRKEFMFRSQ
jgi:glucose-6-phosphate isomerase